MSRSLSFNIVISISRISYINPRSGIYRFFKDISSTYVVLDIILLKVLNIIMLDTINGYC